VLVADDNPDLRRYLTRLLADHFDVEAVSDGAVAFQAAQDHPPDLVITDVIAAHGPLLGVFADAAFPETTGCATTPRSSPSRPMAATRKVSPGAVPGTQAL